MEYLEQFNFTKQDIDEVLSKLDRIDQVEFDVHEDRVCDIINYFKSLHLGNIKELLMYKSYIFYTPLDFIKKKFSEVSMDKILSINENIDVLDEIL
jgi:hypothetical protein